jgi:hypothetical protein
MGMLMFSDIHHLYKNKHIILMYVCYIYHIYIYLDSLELDCTHIPGSILQKVTNYYLGTIIIFFYNKKNVPISQSDYCPYLSIRFLFLARNPISQSDSCSSLSIRLLFLSLSLSLSISHSSLNLIFGCIY